MNIIVSLSAAPKLALKPAKSKPLLPRCKLVIPQCLCQVSLGFDEVQMGAHDFKLNNVPFSALKISKYQCFEVCCPETSSCVSKPLQLRCKVVIPQCLCQVSLGLKEVQMGANDFKLNNVPFSALKISKYQCFEVCCSETSSFASKPLQLRCKVVIC